MKQSRYINCVDLSEIGNQTGIIIKISTMLTLQERLQPVESWVESGLSAYDIFRNLSE
jgi:hypothetical protein